MKPAGICVFGVEPVLTPSINKAVEAGIPVVTILGDLPDSKRVAYVGSSQHDLGYVGGKNLAEAIGGEGKVAILSIPGVQMFDDREEGFRAAFAEFPDIEVVQVGDTKADTVTAINTAKSIMQRFPDLLAFACTDSTGGIGAATAVEEAGKTGEVKINSLDRNSDVLEKIKKGTISGTVVQNDAAMAYWALLVLFNYNNHQPPTHRRQRCSGCVCGSQQRFHAGQLLRRVQRRSLSGSQRAVYAVASRRQTKSGLSEWHLRQPQSQITIYHTSSYGKPNPL